MYTQRMSTYQRSSKWDFMAALLCLLLFLGGVVYFSYNDPIVRLEHFAFLFGILGSLATAGTLIWLVVERSQLQNEKWESEEQKQAAGVSTWLSQKAFGSPKHYSKEIIVLNNNSDSPIYNVVVSIVDARNKDAKGEETPDEFRRIVAASPPGQAFCMSPEGYMGMGFHPSVEIAFSDANGKHWVRRGNGRLEELAEDPFIHYEIVQPPAYEQLHNF